MIGSQDKHIFVGSNNKHTQKMASKKENTLTSSDPRLEKLLLLAKELGIDQEVGSLVSRSKIANPQMLDKLQEVLENMSYNITHIRKNMFMETQDEFARRFIHPKGEEVHRNTISTIERGEQWVQPYMLAQLNLMFGISVDALMFSRDISEKPKDNSYQILMNRNKYLQSKIDELERYIRELENTLIEVQGEG